MDPSMGKNKRRRKSGKLVAIPFEGGLALAGTTDGSVISQGSTSGFAREFYAVFCDIAGYVRDLTAGEGAPSTFVVGHSDYTPTEILEYLEAENVDPGDMIKQEHARRKIRKVGQFRPLGGAAAATSLQVQNRDGGPMSRVPLKFTLSEGNSLEVSWWNRSGATLTPGATMDYDGVLYGRWI